MKAIFIPYNQAYRERILAMLERMSIRGFTLWDNVQGKGSTSGEPHYGSHAWPSLNEAIMTIVPDEKADELLRKLHQLDAETESMGLHAYAWNVENMV